jgi:hypothetical protein
MRWTETGVALELWPMPYTEPSAGLAARHVVGAENADALRNALATAAAVAAQQDTP